MILRVIFTLVAFTEAKNQCKDNQWRKGNECKDLVGFALEYKDLPQQAVDFASGFYDDLDPKAGVSRTGENNWKKNSLNCEIVKSIFHQK